MLLKQCWTEKKGGRSGQETGLQMSGNGEVGTREGSKVIFLLILILLL